MASDRIAIVSSYFQQDIPLKGNPRGIMQRCRTLECHQIPVAVSGCISKGNIAALEIQFGFGWRAKHARASVIEFAFPARDDDRCQTIADQIYTGASHVHQFINAKDDRHTDRSEASRQEAVYGGEQDHQATRAEPRPLLSM